MRYCVRYRYPGGLGWAYAAPGNLNGRNNAFDTPLEAYEGAKAFKSNYNQYDISIQDETDKIVWESPEGPLKPFYDTRQRRGRRFKALR